MLDRLSRGDFYIVCPDNDVTSVSVRWPISTTCSQSDMNLTVQDLDNLRIAWSVGDITENRPALSRWHHDYKAPFDDYVKSNTKDK